jgi:hypothetical protein
MAISKEQARAVIQRIGEGQATLPLLAAIGANWGEFWRALDSDPLLAAEYSRARERKADTFADDIVEIADNDEDPQRARNRIDARKWVASKLQPRTYGDRIDMNVQGQVDLVGILADARRRMLPVSNQQHDALVQDADFVQLPSPVSTDYQSVTPQLQPDSQAPAPLPDELE